MDRLAASGNPGERQVLSEMAEDARFHLAEVRAADPTEHKGATLGALTILSERLSMIESMSGPDLHTKTDKTSEVFANSRDLEDVLRKAIRGSQTALGLRSA